VAQHSTHYTLLLSKVAEKDVREQICIHSYKGQNSAVLQLKHRWQDKLEKQAHHPSCQSAVILPRRAGLRGNPRLCQAVTLLQVYSY